MAPAVNHARRSEAGQKRVDIVARYSTAVSQLLTRYANLEQRYASILGTEFSDDSGLAAVKREAGELYRGVASLSRDVTSLASRFCRDYAALYERLVSGQSSLLSRLRRLEEELGEHRRACSSPRTAEEAALCIRLVERVEEELDKANKEADAISSLSSSLETLSRIADTLSQLKSGVERLEAYARNLNEILEAPLVVTVGYDDTSKALSANVKLDVGTVLDRNKPVYARTLAVLLSDAERTNPVLSALLRGVNPLAWCLAEPQSIQTLLDQIDWCRSVSSFIGRVEAGIRTTLPPGNTLIVKAGRGLATAKSVVESRLGVLSKGVEIGDKSVTLTGTAVYTLSSAPGGSLRISVSYDEPWATLAASKLDKLVEERVKAIIDEYNRLAEEYNSLAEEYDKLVQGNPGRTVYEQAAILAYRLGEKAVEELKSIEERLGEVRKKLEAS